MLVQFQGVWTTLLLLISTKVVAAHAAGPHMVFQPRDLATGTGTSVGSLPPPPSSSPPPPPYPTNTTNGTTITVNTLPSDGSTIATSPPTTTPTTSPSTFFYLIIANTGTPYDGQYLFRTGYKAQTGAIVLYPTPFSDPNAPADDNPQAHFALFNEGAQGVAGIRGDQTSRAWFFVPEDEFDPDPPFTQNKKSIFQIGPDDEVVGDELTCVTGEGSVFYICPFDPVDMTNGEVDVGEVVEEGCTGVRLVAVPV